MPSSGIVDALTAHRGHYAPVIDFDLGSGEVVVFDFTAANTELTHLDINDVTGFTEFLFATIAESQTPVGIGRYDEDRVLYRHSPLFDGQAERRSIHLGIDLFVIESTPIRTPLAARVHSVAENAGLGNYGPTVILSHDLDGTSFHTLYGHLSRNTFEQVSSGQTLAAGEVLGEVGDLHENGGWPPHLHFQIIVGDPGETGDYPGVATPSERAKFLDICPDPNLILGISGLSG